MNIHRFQAKELMGMDSLFRPDKYLAMSADAPGHARLVKSILEISACTQVVLAPAILDRSTNYKVTSCFRNS